MLKGVGSSSSTSREGPLWVAAFCLKKLKKAQVFETDIPSSVGQSSFSLSVNFATTSKSQPTPFTLSSMWVLEEMMEKLIPFFFLCDTGKSHIFDMAVLLLLTCQCSVAGLFFFIVGFSHSLLIDKKVHFLK